MSTPDPPAKRTRSAVKAASQAAANVAEEALKRLNKNQRKALDYAMDGYNLFITGGAGAGKTYVIETIVRELRKNKRKVAVTATTGMASILVSGLTIHSFWGLGIGDMPDHEIARRAKTKKVSAVWAKVNTLVIDEVSMLHPKFLPKLELAARVARKDQRVFGGVQIIFVGDFFQLPPVHIEKPRADEAYFCFETAEWERTVDRVVILDQVYRQEDASFVALLNRCRVGEPTREDYRVLASRVRFKLPEDGIEPTALYPNRRSVDNINKEKIDELRTEERAYAMRAGVYIKRFPEDYNEMPESNCIDMDTAAEEYSQAMFFKIDSLRKNLVKNSPVPEVVTLKVGAQVALVKNLSAEYELVNGSRGIVEGFSDTPPHYPVVRFAKCRLLVRPSVWLIDLTDKLYVFVAQMPLALAYAYTIHRCQGQSLDRAEIDLGKRIFEKGQAYVALSRVRSLGAVSLKAFVPDSIHAHARVIRFQKTLEARVAQQDAAESAAANITVKEEPQSDDDYQDPYDSGSSEE